MRRPCSATHLNVWTPQVPQLDGLVYCSREEAVVHRVHLQRRNPLRMPSEVVDVAIVMQRVVPDRIVALGTRIQHSAGSMSEADKVDAVLL